MRYAYCLNFLTSCLCTCYYVQLFSYKHDHVADTLSSHLDEQATFSSLVINFCQNFQVTARL